MKKDQLLSSVFNILSLAPKHQAGISYDGTTPEYQSGWFTISEILENPSNKYHDFVTNFKGFTVSEFLDYITESGLPIVTNHIIFDIVDKIV